MLDPLTWALWFWALGVVTLIMWNTIPKEVGWIKTFHLLCGIGLLLMGTWDFALYLKWAY